MKKTISTVVFLVALFVHNVSLAQGFQVNPPSTQKENLVYLPHAPYPGSFMHNEPQILSADLNDAANKLLTAHCAGGVHSVQILDVQSGKSTEVKYANASSATRAYFLNENFVAIKSATESPSFDIIELSSNNVIASIPANRYIGSSNNTAFFSNQNGSSAAVMKFDLTNKKQSNSFIVPGEVFGWYFNNSLGVVGVLAHQNMISRLYKVEKEKLGKSIYEFPSGSYFEAKGSNSTGDIFYGITNIQAQTSYAGAISAVGLKNLSNKPNENCTDIFVAETGVVLSTNNLNAAEYQESKNSEIQNILAFAAKTFKGASVKIIEYIERKNTILFCLESETIKPKYFIWSNGKAKPVSSDKYDSKNLIFISSEVAQIQTGELTPQTGRMFLPTRTEKSSYPLVIFIPQNIFLPYPNRFNPMVQHLCQNGFAVFVWNTRYSSRPKVGFSYSDLVGSFSEDVSLVLSTLQKDYPLSRASTFLFGEGLGAYLALNASGAGNFSGTFVNHLEFPGALSGQDLNAVRLFGEDAQEKWKSLDNLELSPKCNYFSVQSTKSNMENRLTSNLKQNQINWNEQVATSNDLDAVLRWIQHLSPMKTQVIDDSPKVEVKTK